jgi:hypothetical protein
VLGKSHGDPGMRKLEEGSAAGGEKEGGFAVDLPAYGVCAEDAGERVSDISLDGCKEGFEVLAPD